jgi:hypothetical protein
MFRWNLKHPVRRYHVFPLCLASVCDGCVCFVTPWLRPGGIAEAIVTYIHSTDMQLVRCAVSGCTKAVALRSSRGGREAIERTGAKLRDAANPSAVP